MRVKGIGSSLHLNEACQSLSCTWMTFDSNGQQIVSTPTCSLILKRAFDLKEICGQLQSTDFIFCVEVNECWDWKIS